MRGYKIFERDYICRDYKYSLTEPNIYKGSVHSIHPCVRGFHFCINAIDCLNYYNYTPTNTYALVESGDNYIVKDDKVVCDKLTIVQTLTYEEFGKLVNGVRRKYWSDGQLMDEIEYVNGVISGSCKRWHDNGNKMEESTYENGVLQGKFKEWYSDGSPEKEINYENGKHNGELIHWWKNGNKRIQVMCVDGNPIGNFKSWNMNGTLMEERNYVDGGYTSLQYHENGVLSLDTKYVKGKIHGHYKEWWSNGELKTSTTYVNGDLHGEFKQWDKNGTLIEECNFVDGRRHGCCKRWYRDGRLLYIDGELADDSQC